MSFLRIIVVVILPLAFSALIFNLTFPDDVNIADYSTCLKKFYQARPVWSWIIIHKKDKNQSFENLLIEIYKIRVPVYNSYQSPYSRWFINEDFSSIARESKIFILSKSSFYLDLIGIGRNSFRRGDKILFTNYNITTRNSRIAFSSSVAFFGLKTDMRFLTKYNLFPAVSFLFVNYTSSYPVTYIPIGDNKTDLKSVQEVFFPSCDKLFANSFEQLIFNANKITVAIFETVHAIKTGDDYFGRDAIIGKLLIRTTGLSEDYITPSDGFTYGNETFIMDKNNITRNFPGVYGLVASGKAQMAFNSRLLITSILMDNVVEHTYPYNRDDLIILIPIELTHSTIYYLTPYSCAVSLIIIFLLYLYFKLTKKAKSLIDVSFIFLRVCIAQPLDLINIKFFRIIYMSMMVLAFYGYTLFNIQILSALTLTPTEVSIKTVEEFSRTKFIIHVSATDAQILKESFKTDQKHAAILNRIESPFFENETMHFEADLLQNRYKNAIITRKSTALYYMDLNNLQGKEFFYNIVPEAIMPSLVTYILGYRSPLQEKFNILLSRIIESGLLENLTISVKKTHLSDEVKPFGWSSIGEKLPWFVFIGGIIVSSMVFIGELVLNL